MAPHKQMPAWAKLCLPISKSGKNARSRNVRRILRRSRLDIFGRASRSIRCPPVKLVNLMCEVLLVHDSNPCGPFKIEFRFWNGNLLLPIAEAKLRFNVSGLADYDSGQPVIRGNF